MLPAIQSLREVWRNDRIHLIVTRRADTADLEMHYNNRSRSDFLLVQAGMGENGLNGESVGSRANRHSNHNRVKEELAISPFLIGPIHLRTVLYSLIH
jgi:hypothetical protein